MLPALLAPSNIRALYAGFDTPLADMDCGQKCAPYNGGIPVCCDIQHAVPTAFPTEWIHLRARTNLWQVWLTENKAHRDEIQADAGDLILLECLMLTPGQPLNLPELQHPERSGNEPNRAINLSPAQSKDAAQDDDPRTLRLRKASAVRNTNSAQSATSEVNQASAPSTIAQDVGSTFEPYCRRDLRTLVCRAFPFFPYFDSHGDLLGLSYYWIYADRCWVISNLQIVRPEYKNQFIETYENLFAQMPAEREGFQYHSAEMRREFQTRRRTIPLLHRDGHTYKISPATETMRRVEPDSFPKYGPYKIADTLLFPDEELVHR